MRHKMPALRVSQSWENAYEAHCPVCGDENQHHGRVLTFDREGGEDGPTTVWSHGARVLTDPPENPSSRRNAVRIEFWGECGHEWHLDVIQHKGTTYLMTEGSDERREDL